MSKQITVPFGPQHPVLPEPIHLDLVLEEKKAAMATGAPVATKPAGGA